MLNNEITLDFNALMHEMDNFKMRFLNWLKTIRDTSVVNPELFALVTEFCEQDLSQEGVGLSGAVNEFITRVTPGFANTAGPRAFPWIVGGVTPAAFIGGLYMLMYDQINMVSGVSIGPKLEQETMKLLMDLFQLPKEEFHGTLTTGATASNICALACARQWWGKLYGIDVAQNGTEEVPESMEVYSATYHASIPKALSILGIGRNKLISVGTLEHREAIDPKALDRALSLSTVKGKVVVASAGTVNSGDFDNLKELAHLCQKHQAWLHVDGAFGLFARCSENKETL